MPSASTRRRNRAFESKLAAARILAKLALYFMSFGLLLLIMGGIRGILFPNHSPSKVLVILGVITSSLGVLYTIISLVMMRSLSRQAEGMVSSSLFNTWMRSASCNDVSMNNRDTRRQTINTISRSVESGASRNFSYSNPALMAVEDAKNWEPPPAYSETDPCPEVVLTVNRQSQ